MIPKPKLKVHIVPVQALWRAKSWKLADVLAELARLTKEKK